MKWNLLYRPTIAGGFPLSETFKLQFYFFFLEKAPVSPLCHSSASSNSELFLPITIANSRLSELFTMYTSPFSPGKTSVLTETSSFTYTVMHTIHWLTCSHTATHHLHFSLRNHNCYYITKEDLHYLVKVFAGWTVFVFLGKKCLHRQ